MDTFNNYDARGPCNLPNCFQCIRKKPVKVQDKEIQKCLKDFENMEVELQEKWAKDLHWEFREADFGFKEIAHDPNFCYHMIKLGVMNTIIRVFLLDSTSHKTRFHLLGALRNLSFEKRCKHVFMQSPDAGKVIKNIVDSEWFMYKAEGMSFISDLARTYPVKELQIVFTPDVMRKILFSLTTPYDEITANYKNEGKFQQDIVFPFLPEGRIEYNLITDCIGNYRRNIITFFGSFLSRFSDKPDGYLQVLNDLQEDGVKFLFDNIINHEDPIMVKHASVMLVGLVHLSKFTVQPEILISMLESAYTELNENTESRKQLRDIVIKYKDHVQTYLDSCFEEIVRIMKRVSKIRDFQRLDARLIVSNLHLVQFLAGDEYFIENMNLNKFYPIVSKLRLFWESINPINNEDYNEKFIINPGVTIAGDDSFFVKHYYLWVIHSIILILLRLHYAFRRDEKLPEPIVFTAKLLIRNSGYRVGPDYQIAYGFRHEFCHLRACIALEEEMDKWEINSLTAKTSYTKSKIISRNIGLCHLFYAGLIGIFPFADINPKLRNALTLKHVDLAEQNLHPRTDKKFLKITKAMREDVLKTNKCNLCSRTPRPQETFSLCSRCKSVRYCGKSCQIDDWPTHKTMCRR